MELSINDLKQLIGAGQSTNEKSDIAGFMLGEYVIIRTYSAGVWAGTLAQKSGNEVILKEARRLWYWKAASGISLSAVAVNGVASESKITEAVPNVWLEAIEIIPASAIAISSIKGAPNAKAQ